MTRSSAQPQANATRRRRRGRGEGGIYQEADGSWRASLNLGTSNGKRQRRVFRGKSRNDVRQKLLAAQQIVAGGLPLPGARLTVGGFLDRWLEEVVKPKNRPLTYVAYKSKVDLHITPALGLRLLVKLTPDDVQSFLNAKSKTKLSPRMVRELRGVLRTALNRAMKWGLVLRNVAALTDAPRVEDGTVTVLAPDDARALLHAARGDRLEALYTVALAVGLRRGEALGLRWQDVDLDAGDLHVRKQLQRIDGRLELQEPKTRKARRSVALPGIAVTALREHRRRQAAERLATGPAWTDSGLVFTSEIGTPMDPDNLKRSWYALRKRAGLDTMRFHDLRHACATLLLAQGVHPRVVMETLGHSQIAVTMNVYSHVLPVLQREAADALDAALAGVS